MSIKTIRGAAEANCAWSRKKPLPTLHINFA